MNSTCIWLWISVNIVYLEHHQHHVSHQSWINAVLHQCSELWLFLCHKCSSAELIQVFESFCWWRFAQDVGFSADSHKHRVYRSPTDQPHITLYFISCIWMLSCCSSCLFIQFYGCRPILDISKYSTHKIKINWKGYTNLC